MAVGLPLKTTYADGDVYSASDVNDTNGTVNLVGQTNNVYAAKNKIINGNFANWQRGTSFTPTAGTLTYTADRFMAYIDGNGAYTVSRQTFTPGSAPVAGYESAYYMRQLVNTKGTSTYVQWEQRIEDVRTFAGQSITISFWARLNSGTVSSATVYAYQNFGSGGSGEVYPTSQTFTPTSSWARYSFTIAIPSISGKTIGTGSFLGIDTYMTYSTAPSIDYWGVQVEQGSTATAFQTATGTIQGELAACQRYYYRPSGQSAYAYYGVGLSESGSFSPIFFPLPVSLRTTTGLSVDYANLAQYDGQTVRAVTSVAINHYTNTGLMIGATSTGGGLTTSRPAALINNNNANGYIGISAEL